MGHGGWPSQELETDAFPLKAVATDPPVHDGYGWIFAKEADDVTELWFRDDNSDNDPIQLTKDGRIFVAAVDRSTTTKAVDAALAEDEIRFGLVEVTVTGKTMTLPAPTSDFDGCDVIIGPVGAFFTTVAIAGGGSFGGGGTTSQKVARGTAAHFVCDGSTWFMAGGGGAETMALVDLTDVTGTTGSGGIVPFATSPSIATPTFTGSFSLPGVASDPISPANGDVWFNTTTKRFTARENGLTFAFAAESVKYAHLYAGADVGAKINAAIAAAATGDVVDSKYLTGTASTGVVIDKKIKLVVGESITWTVSPGIWVIHGTEDPDAYGQAAGAEIEGSGGFGSLMNANVGGTFILIESEEVVVRSLGIAFASANASNVGIAVRKAAAASFGNVRPVIEKVRVDGNGSLGSGITFEVVFGAHVTDTEIREFQQGIWSKDNILGGCTALHFDDVRCFANDYGIRFTNVGGATIGNQSTCEGNSIYQVWIESGDGVRSSSNHYECTNGSQKCVYVEPINDGFQRSHHFVNDFFFSPQPSEAVVIGPGGAGQQVFVWGGEGVTGFKAQSGFIVVKGYGLVSPGANSGNVITEQITSAAGTVYFDTGIPSVSRYFSGWSGVNFDTPVVLNFSAAAGNVVTIKGTFDGALTIWNPATDSLGMGTTPFAHSKLSVYNTVSPTSGVDPARVVTVLGDWNPTGNTAAGCEAMNIESGSRFGNTHTFAFLQGLDVTTNHRGTNTVSSMITADFVGINSGSGDASSMTLLLLGAFQTGAGTTASAIGVRFLTPTVSAGVMTAWTALRIDTPSGATFNTSIDVQGGDMLFNSAAGSPLFLVYGVGDVFPSNMTWRVDTTNARVQVGGTLIGLGKFAVSETSAITSSTGVEAYFSYTIAPASASSANWRDGLFEVVKTGTQNITGSITGAEFDVYSNAAAGLISTAYGSISKIINQGAGGGIGVAIGEFIQVVNSSTGYITSAAGIEVGAPVNSGGGLFGTWYGILLDNPGTSASAAYAIYSGGGYTVFNASQTGISDVTMKGQNDAIGFFWNTSLDSLGIGISSPAQKLDVLGAIQFTLGSGSQTVLAIGKAHIDTTAVGNVGAGEDVLMTWDLGANSLHSAGQGLRATFMGTFANNANAKTLKIYVGTAVQTISLTANLAGTWKVVVEVFSTGTDTQDYFATCVTTGVAGVAVNQLNIGTLANDDGAAITIKATGDATSNNDIVEELLLVEGLD